MSSRPAPGSRERLVPRLLRTLGWLVGAPVAIFRFLSREMSVEYEESVGDSPPLLAEEPDLAQREDEQAVGPVVHRLYSATIRAPKLTADRLVAIIAADPNVIAPSEVLRFEKTRGEPGALQEGDTMLIRMAGPWNGPVEVTRRWEQGFRLAARPGHPQLGQVELRAWDEGGEIAMHIQTRERAAGLSFRLLQGIGLIQRMQTYTWAEMLENAAQIAGGRRLERVTVRSWRGGGARTFEHRRPG
jgi:hypothetical protein